MGIFSLFNLSNTVYFPGCTTYFKFKEHFEIYQKIFAKLGINFRIIDKKICSGIESLEAGYESEARKLARRNFEIFKEENINAIITNSPEAFKTSSVRITFSVTGETSAISAFKFLICPTYKSTPSISF